MENLKLKKCKHEKIFTIILPLLIILTCNCSNAKKNKGSNEVKQSKTETFMSAKINGVNFYSDNPTYLKIGDFISIKGKSKDKTEIIRLQIRYDNSSTTYTVDKKTNNKGNMIYTYNKEHWITSKHRGEGAIILTEKGGYLIGEFSFTGDSGSNTKQITDGKFKVKMKK